MKPNPVVWFEIYVQDMERARKFYETVFRCQLEPMAAPEGEASGHQEGAGPGSPASGAGQPSELAIPIAQALQRELGTACQEALAGGVLADDLGGGLDSLTLGAL